MLLTAYDDTVPFIVETFTLYWNFNVLEKKLHGYSKPQESTTASKRACVEQSKQISAEAVVALHSFPLLPLVCSCSSSLTPSLTVDWQFGSEN